MAWSIYGLQETSKARQRSEFCYEIGTMRFFCAKSTGGKHDARRIRNRIGRFGCRIIAYLPRRVEVPVRIVPG